jgi:hypothetical protein
MYYRLLCVRLPELAAADGLLFIGVQKADGFCSVARDFHAVFVEVLFKLRHVIAEFERFGNHLAQLLLP